MSAPLQYPLINGFRKSFVSLECLFFASIGVALSAGGANAALAVSSLNLNMRGYKNIHLERTKTRGIAKGTHPDPLGKTRGSNAYKGTIEMLHEEFYLLQAQLASLQADYGNAFFSFSRTYTEPGTGTIKDTAIGCTLDSTEGTDEQGDDPSVRKIDISPLKIYFNGLDDEIPLAALPI